MSPCSENPQWADVRVQRANTSGLGHGPRGTVPGGGGEGGGRKGPPSGLGVGSSGIPMTSHTPDGAQPRTGPPELGCLPARHLRPRNSPLWPLPLARF